MVYARDGRSDRRKRQVAGTGSRQGQIQEGRPGTGSSSKVCDADRDQTLEIAAKSGVKPGEQIRQVRSKSGHNRKSK